MSERVVRRILQQLNIEPDDAFLSQVRIQDNSFSVSSAASRDNLQVIQVPKQRGLS